MLGRFFLRPIWVWRNIFAERNERFAAFLIEKKTDIYYVIDKHVAIFGKL